MEGMTELINGTFIDQTRRSLEPLHDLEQVRVCWVAMKQPHARAKFLPDV
jgi:hypothetical protein